MIVTLEYAAASGWGWNVHLARLPSGGLFVYSPAWLGDDTFAQVEKHGTPEVLFCPNNVHHVSLEKFRAKWPQAIACASRPALKRLAAHGHAGLRDASDVPLPAGAKLLVAEAVASGETFLSLDGEWIVCDAFTNFARPLTGVASVGLRLLEMRSGEVCVSTLFKRFAVKDRAAYRRWLFDALDREKPRTVHFSHGAPASDAVERLKAAASARL